MADINLNAITNGGISLAVDGSNLDISVVPSAFIGHGTDDPTQTPPTGNEVIYIRTSS